MIFKDREEAGRLLAETLEKRLKQESAGGVVFSPILNSGVMIVSGFMERCSAPVLALPLERIMVPDVITVPIGAVSYQTTYLEPRVVNQLPGLKKSEITKSITAANQALEAKIRDFTLDYLQISKNIAGKTVVIFDDGIVTGSAMRTAILTVSLMKPKTIIAAVPLIINGFYAPGTEVYTIQIAKGAPGIRPFYRFLPDIGNREALSILAGFSR